MLTIYSPPKLQNQFAFEKLIKERVDESVAINIDVLDGWHIYKIIEIVSPNESVPKLTFASKKRGRIYTIAMVFKHSKLWFIDTQSERVPYETIDGWNFLTVSRV